MCYIYFKVVGDQDELVKELFLELVVFRRNASAQCTDLQKQRNLFCGSLFCSFVVRIEKLDTLRRNAFVELYSLIV